MSSSSPSALPGLLSFDATGLLPVIVQDHLTGEIRMFAFATAEALRMTLETGRATFWSRSRGELWVKGMTSGNAIHVVRVLVDCDADCVIYESEPEGPSCHTGAVHCFFRTLGPDGQVQEGPAPAQTLVARLEAVLEARKTSTGAASYTKSLYDAGPAKIGAKIREEAGELAQALEAETDDRVVSEAADTLYHMLVGLRSRSLDFRLVLAALEARHGVGGHVEKASRSR